MAWLFDVDDNYAQTSRVEFAALCKASNHCRSSTDHANLLLAQVMFLQAMARDEDDPELAAQCQASLRNLAKASPQRCLSLIHELSDDECTCAQRK